MTAAFGSTSPVVEFWSKAVLWSLLWLACDAHAEWQTRQQSIMGTEVSVTLWAEAPERGTQGFAAVFAELRRIDQTYSPYIETSALSALNREASQAPQPVSDEMFFLLERAAYFSELTEGAFDITFASLGWYYDYRKRVQPSRSETERLLPAINYKSVVLDAEAQTVRFAHKNIRIDLGGIAKGYAVDRAASVLRELGFTDATVSAGGDSRILGDKRGKPWLIGIKHPRPAVAGATETVLTLPLVDTALSTSGDYERYFIDANGQRVHHILNPRTGRPTEGIMSVTVLGALGVDTDALSTSVFVKGVDEGLALINALDGFDAVVITTDGQVHYSAGLGEPR